jgi:hypothetical protein
MGRLIAKSALFNSCPATLLVHLTQAKVLSTPKLRKALADKSVKQSTKFPDLSRFQLAFTGHPMFQGITLVNYKSHYRSDLLSDACDSNSWGLIELLR